MFGQRTLILTTALGLTLVAGAARADGPGAAYGGEEIGTVRFVDRAQNLVELTNGDEFYAHDARMLQGVWEGELVKVDFTHDGDRATLNAIEPADENSTLGPMPVTEGGIKEH
jgi:hypothetical protein